MGNKSPKNDYNLPPKEIMSATLSEIVLDHIEVHYAPLRHAREKLARAANVTPHSARNWLRRQCVPQADNLGEFIKNDPVLRAKVLAWIQQETA